MNGINSMEKKKEKELKHFQRLKYKCYNFNDIKSTYSPLWYALFQPMRISNNLYYNRATSS